MGTPKLNFFCHQGQPIGEILPAGHNTARFMLKDWLRTHDRWNIGLNFQFSFADPIAQADVFAGNAFIVIHDSRPGLAIINPIEVRKYLDKKKPQ